MTRNSIPFDQLMIKAHDIWIKQGMLLTAGDFASGRFNTMAIGWGSIGMMWKQPFVQVVVRPSRYTREFMEQYVTFTVSAFPPEFKRALMLLGTKSGRNGDKIAEAGLTPVASSEVAAPGFAEANLILECRKIYWDDMAPASFLDPDIEANYPHKDYHRIYFGRIVAVFGTDFYRV